MDSIPRICLWLGRVVAASVSEGMRIHSLTLAATSEMKIVNENWHRSGLIDGFGIGFAGVHGAGAAAAGLGSGVFQPTENSTLMTRCSPRFTRPDMKTNPPNSSFCFTSIVTVSPG